jgi:hypothetical protein
VIADGPELAGHDVPKAAIVIDEYNTVAHDVDVSIHCGGDVVTLSMDNILKISMPFWHKCPAFVPKWH